jgi:hypothetical protein
MGGIMKRSTIIFVLILLMLGYLSGYSQVSEKKKYHEPDSADLQEGSGRIILNGRLLDPPYEITTDGETIIINGHDIYLNPRKGNIITDTSLKAQIEVTNQLFELFDDWYFEVGFDSARHLALNYLENQSVVDSAYFDEDQILRAKFRSQIWPEAILITPPDSTKENQESAKKDFLKRQTSILKECLSGGMLLIITNGVIEYKMESTEILREIGKIMSSDRDCSESEKKKNLAKLLGHDETADSILNNWELH